MLKKENVHKTDHKKSVFNKGYNSDGVPFRLYNSPVYSEERTHMYRGVPNGYMMATKTFGRPDHRVVRSHKFGNTCRDCQHILQNLAAASCTLAPAPDHAATASRRDTPSYERSREGSRDGLDFLKRGRNGHRARVRCLRSDAPTIRRSRASSEAGPTNDCHCSHSHTSPTCNSTTTR